MEETQNSKSKILQIRDFTVELLEFFLEFGGHKKTIIFLIISTIALSTSIFNLLPNLPFDIAWVAIILCGLPIILEAFIGLITSFDIKAIIIAIKAGTRAQKESLNIKNSL